MSRKAVNTTLNEELYQKIRILALKKGCNANDLMEEGMKMVLNKYEKQEKE
ncbi:MAG: ribbon-helix-helix domain-containing protein [Bacillota bacterium]